ncbi:iron complex transport system substrate-binding protein [Fodinibius salinus]|uniref:Iron complex transport system substrate-binding protein n=1 Tax=Fodinibius salinus TaxID=860790 RepID=A0A5D3YM25_9BACT|nr:ABC transporter substrate-binding protein [Fodinibius salinus]TYP94994.1 iron complex transport system substrate-binding protein [Fodinibius salinus]
MIQRLSSFLHVRSFLLVLFVVIVGWGCQSADPPQDSQQSATVDSVRFSHQVHAKYADGFQISYHQNYKLLEILKPFQDQVDTLRYSLVPREIADQIQVKNTEEIAIPVRSLIATSTTHLGLTEMLNINGIITGMVGAEYVYNRQIRNRFKEGKITRFTSGEFNKEQAMAMQPDLLMISGGESSQFDNYRVLMESGIDVMVNSEWLETTPLGKAEWVKVMAALVNKEKLANQKFGAVAKEYNRLKAATDTVGQKPLVINNMPYKGAWFVSGGDSFTARYLKDAGADYPWYSSSETGGLRKDFEAVYEKGLQADVWLNPGATTSKEEVLAKDARFKDFKSYQTGRIYNNNRRLNESGGNDFWESGVVHPEILLADLIKILHPELVPDHELYYYQQLD